MNNDLISREALKEELSRVLLCEEPNSRYRQIIGIIDNALTVDAYTPEQVKELVDLNKKLSEERLQGDLISRDALKHKFAQITYVRFTADMGQGGFEMFSEKEIEDIIDKAPSMEIKKPQGLWVKKQDDVSYWYECDQCGARPPRNYLGTDYFSDFCPSCGTPMLLELSEEQDE